MVETIIRHLTPFALPARSLNLKLPVRQGDGASILLELESQAGNWAFEDGDVIVLAASTFTMPRRALVLTLD